jgi:nicotinamidase-related amidase
MLASLLLISAASVHPRGPPIHFDAGASFALLVIDMQNVFRPPMANSSIVNTNEMISEVQETINTFRAFKDTGRAHIVYTQHGYVNGTTCDHHSEYKRYWHSRGEPSNCDSMSMGSDGFKLISEIQPRLVDGELILRKEVYDAFHESSLHNRLQEWGVDTVVISGWDTNICCDSTARAAFFRDYRVIFLSDGTATPNGYVVLYDRLYRA